MSFYRACCLFFLGNMLLIVSCRKAEKTEETDAPEENVAVAVPAFSPDSAYAYIEKQVSFGPRVPGSAAQRKCADWISAQFRAFGYEVTEQKFTGVLYDKRTVPGINLIASYKPEAAKRILLAAHWDSRAISDHDPDVKNKPIDGANDGASGVGVLMEIARNLVKDSATVGVDFILFDVEDWGAPDSYTDPVTHPYGGYCLGSEYWSQNLHKPGYSPLYGILLDMVGASGAQFHHEEYSFYFAPTIVSKVWSTASQLGFSQYFINRKGGGVTDDHVPVNQHAKIPMIDIIDYRMDSTGGGFFPHWHTTGDKLSAIDKQTLKAVGQTVMHVVYQEK